MINRILGVFSILLFLAAPVFADAPDGLPTGKRQHEPVKTTKPMDKATPARSETVDSHEDSDDQMDIDTATKAAESDEKVKPAMDGKAVHQPGGSATGATRRRGAADDENVEEKTDKSEAARARKKQ